MICIYQAADLVEGNLLKQMLEAEGIFAHLQGEYLQGAIGELPVGTQVMLMVRDEDAARARSIVEDWERATIERETPAEGAQDMREQKASARSASVTRASGMTLIAAVCLFLAGLALGGVLGWFAPRVPTLQTEIDYDGDKRVDERLYFAGDRIGRIESDRNRDGRVDQIQRFDRDGLSERIEVDDDFDGRFEGYGRYRHNQMQSFIVDHDGDDEPDYRIGFEHGAMVHEEWLDASGRVVKRVEYRASRPLTSAVDRDGDGRLDTTRRYDARGEIVATQPLAPTD